MKRSGLIGLIILGSGSAWAQSSPTIRPRVGVIAGLSFASNSTVSFLSFGTQERVGLQVGVCVASSPRPWLSVQSALLYSPKGYSVVSNGYSFLGSNFSPYTKQWRLNYLELPLAARIQPFKRHAHGAFLELGPQLSYLLSARYQFSSTAQSSDDDVASAYRSLLGGYLLGVGYQAQGSLQAFSVGFRHTEDFALAEIGNIFNGGRNTTNQLYLNFQFGRN